jgi:membrane protein implicated in regulation of membrane protease activity
MDVLLLALRILLTILLYAFLAAVLLMLWRDLRQATGGRTLTRLPSTPC